MHPLRHEREFLMVHLEGLRDRGPEQLGQHRKTLDHQSHDSVWRQVVREVSGHRKFPVQDSRVESDVGLRVVSNGWAQAFHVNPGRSQTLPVNLDAGARSTRPNDGKF